MQSIALRTFGKLEYRDPRPFLVRLRKFELELSASATPERVRNLRTNKLKAERELREAAIFCYLAGQRMGTTVGLAPGEKQDYDFVAAWSAQDQACFAPVQLKELPPEATAPAATLQDIISGLGQYTSSSELVVAIHLNRAISFDPSALAIPPLQIAELWAFGATSPDQNTWALWGDLLRSPTASYHAYPAA
ncbi:hypothetical protein ABT392_05440 [Paucibacter sp. JuS9]|uniref:hypothetical protein n=1 Tax=Paucibacter sp. JuS9 TaxID=3228748 RepID=UPI00375801AF